MKRFHTKSKPPTKEPKLGQHETSQQYTGFKRQWSNMFVLNIF